MDKLKIIIPLLLLAALPFALQYAAAFPNLSRAGTQSAFWPVESIDTMKYSRDTAGAKLGDPSFDAVIDTQVKAIAATGADYVAIGTPYDDRFVPFLSRWVAAARRYNLHVWFRGNFSGWEGWFNYPKIDRTTHTEMTRNFILSNPDLFRDGDIFSSCPECENGGPGDPRQNGDVEGHRLFLIHEHEVAGDAFRQINKNVDTRFNSMNRDVANLIMDKRTTAALGGVVVIDHYVATPEKLASDIAETAANSGGKVFLGEFGAPLPGITADMNDEEQAAWLSRVLQNISGDPDLIGVNYWVGFGGSTAIFADDGSFKPAAQVLKQYFATNLMTGKVEGLFGQPIVGAKIQLNNRTVLTRQDGTFKLPFVGSVPFLIVTADGYADNTVQNPKTNGELRIIMQKNNPGVFYPILATISNLFLKLGLY